MLSRAWRSGIVCPHAVFSSMTKMVSDRGALIIIEGGDRVGKSTLLNKLMEKMQEEKMPVDSYKFPNRETAIGQVIDSHLRKAEVLEDHAIHLLFAANRWECVDHILKKLSSGLTLLVDRYSYSGIAYSAAKSGMTLEWCKAPEIGLPKPDLVFHVTVPEDVASNREGYGDEIYECVEFQKKVNAVFRLLRQETKWVTLNAEQPIEDLVEQAMKCLKSEISCVKNLPVSRIS